MRALTIVLLGLLLPLHVSMACGVVAEARAVRLAAASQGAGGEAGARITFLGHASFLIESAEHVTAVTDYNGYNIPNSPPDIATMNRAHITHYTDFPDPRIAHVLHGWRDDGGPAQIDLTVGDLRVTNLPTSTRDWAGGPDRDYGNSIFVFETGGLCIAHLSHLHHLLTEDDVAALGRPDVVMAPADGVWTLSPEDIAAVIAQLHPPVVIPMHFYAETVLSRFLAILERRYEVRRNATSSVTISRADLPPNTEILILKGY